MRDDTLIKRRRTLDAKGNYFAAAICTKCKRDASQTHMSHYCDAAMGLTPMLCDTCRDPFAHVNQ